MQRRLRHLAEAAGLWLVFTVFASLPIEGASRLGGALGRAIGPRLAASRRAFENLRLALPDNSDAENRRIVRGMWDNLGRSVAELPHLEKICAAGSQRIEIVDGGDLTALVAARQPAILFGGHFANWEVAPVIFYRTLGPTLLSVYRASNNPWANRVLLRRLSARRAVSKGSAGGRELIRHLRDGGQVAMLVDQKMNDGIAVPFFGRDAMTAPAIARLALRFGCPIIPVRVERLNGARFRFTVLPRLELDDTRDTARNVFETMKRVNAIVEGWIVTRPEQWLWVHRRWPN